MPRRSLLTDTERNWLLAIPEDEAELIRLVTFSEPDVVLINQHRGDANRFGFAMQLCYLRHFGCVLDERVRPPAGILKRVAKALKLNFSE